MTACCSLCDGGCVGADLAPLIDPRLAWLWQQIAEAADRRGDPSLADGTLLLRAPEPAEARAAAAGLLGGRSLRARQRRRVDLAQFTIRLRNRGTALTPGAVAAHALGRALATVSQARAERLERAGHLEAVFVGAAQRLPAHLVVEPSDTWRTLRRNGWLARVLAAPDPVRLLRTAGTVLAALPSAGTTVDRRRLASEATANPHGLDEGTPVAGLVLAVLAAAGHIPPRERASKAWRRVGVRCDDIIGGLVAVGILPIGWTAPRGAPLTLPPRVLATCQWPAPSLFNDPWVFVTENPSVAGAAADVAMECEHLRLLCTSGTPSGLEVAAIGRLSSVGWSVAVRADFDEAGLVHAATLLAGIPGAIPWRMGVEDYLASLESMHLDVNLVTTDSTTMPATPWDPRLSEAIQERGVVAFEEYLLGELLGDLRRGAP